MTAIRFWLLYSTTCLAILGAILIPTRAEADPLKADLQSLRPFTVKDHIEMVYFADLRSAPVKGSARLGGFSPDGTLYARVTHRGVLPEGVTVSTVWIFESKSIAACLRDKKGTKKPKPRKLATLSAVMTGESPSAEGNVITRIQWSLDGKSVYFIGIESSENRHLYRADIADGKVARLTLETQNLGEFAEVNGMIVYSASPAIDVRETWHSTGEGIPDVQVGTGISIVQLLYPNWRRNMSGEMTRSIWKFVDGKHHVLQPSVNGKPPGVFQRTRGGEPVLVSPDGRYAVVRGLVERVPHHWQSYLLGSADRGTDLVTDTEHMQSGSKPMSDYFRPQQYFLFDLNSGASRPVVDAPLVWNGQYVSGKTRFYNNAAWSPEGNKVALTDTYLPAQSDQLGRGHRQPYGLVIVDAASGAVEFAFPHAAADSGRCGLTGLTWRQDGRIVRECRSARPDEVRWMQVFEHTSEGWLKSAATDISQVDAKKNRPFSISIHESLNEPPVLVATDHKTGRQRTFFDPNPKLKSMTLGEAELYRWKDKFGREITGALVKPPGFASGKRYPLVIVTHGFSPDHFLRTSSSSISVPRVLANRGMMALLVNEPHDYLLTPEEAENDGMIPYLAAIDQLVVEGLVDPERVGIDGVSRMGGYAWTTLTKEPHRFAAAALHGASTLHLMTYLLAVDYASPTFLKNYRAQIGAHPFGDGLKTWMENSPGFNLDQIHTPVLVGAGNPWQLIFDWPNYASLRALKKPVELLYIRSGNHPLIKPMQRWVSQEMHVDWFDFWLNGHESPDEGKREQYVRWRKLRELHAADVKKWKAVPTPET